MSEEQQTEQTEQTEKDITLLYSAIARLSLRMNRLERLIDSHISGGAITLIEGQERSSVEKLEDYIRQQEQDTLQSLWRVLG